MQKRWSICDLPEDLGPLEPGPEEPGLEAGTEERAFDGGYPLRKCRSSFDIAMDSLRKEIVSGFMFMYFYSLLKCIGTLGMDLSWQPGANITARKNIYSRIHL